MCKRIISLLVVAVLLGGMIPVSAAEAGSTNFEKVNYYRVGMFADVPSNAWYAENVKLGYELGLIKGASETTFEPDSNVTIAETLVFACRLHSIYYTGSASFVQGSPWYQVYVDYAIDNGIIDRYSYSDYNAYATRAEFATILASALPEEALPAINNVYVGSVPDVPGWVWCADDVYMLYNAGILTGSNERGVFYPNNTIMRSEVAAIVTRMADASLRRQFELIDFENENNNEADYADIMYPCVRYYGSISSTNDEDWYSLRLTEPGTVTFSFTHDVIDSARDYWSLYIYDGSDYSGYSGDLELIMSHYYAGKDAKANSQTVGLPAGDYYVKVTDYGSYNNPMTYGLTAVFAPTEYCEKELNETAAEATSIEPNISYIGSISDSEDEDWYKLTLTEAGTVTLNLAYELFDTVLKYWRIYVYDGSNYNGYSGDLEQILSRDFAGKDANTDTQILGLSAGEYYVQITDYGGYYDTRTYGLTAKFSPTEYCEREPNDDVSEASIMNTNIAYIGSISDSEDEDWYKFTLTEAGTVTFNLAYELSDSILKYWRLYVYDGNSYSGYSGDLEQILSRDYAGKDANTDTQILGLSAGEYYVQITDYGGYYDTRTYGLTAKFSPTEYCEREPNDDVSEASMMNTNIAYIGSISDSEDEDWYKLTLTEAGTITFNLAYELSDSILKYWRVYVYDGSSYNGYSGDLEQILSRDYAGKDANTDTQILGLSAGEYYIQITDYGGYYDTRTYELTAKYTPST